MNPYIHAKNSAKKYGGSWESYLHVHQFMDSAKAHIPDIRHRLILHNSFGIALAEQVCGDVEVVGEGDNRKVVRVPYIRNSEGTVVFIRDIAQDHVREDMGNTIPTLIELWSFLDPKTIAERIGVLKPIIRWYKKNLMADENVEADDK